MGWMMWYFSWILGVCLAASFAVLNAMWLELEEDDSREAGKKDVQGGPAAD
jgi:cytochrome bd-I ubiquinol oxidase subunit X